MSDRHAPPSRLDRPAARVAAIGVAVLCGLALAFIHRDDLFPSEAASEAMDDPVVRCVTERSIEIDRMIADGLVDEARASLFRTRAEAMCQSTIGDGNGTPRLPGQ